MKKLRNTFFYIGIAGSLSCLIVLTIWLGADLDPGRGGGIAGSAKNHLAAFFHLFAQNLKHPLAILLAQIILIVLVARLFGWGCRKIGQPRVIGEILAGIVLGPSLLGFYFPAAFSVVFPAESLDNLHFVSQIGLILFMFVIGLELDLSVLKTNAHHAIIISYASVILPLASGIALAYFLYASFAPPGVAFSSFGLFLGVALSITAFPVLARIAKEKDIHRSRIGTIAVTCAASADIIVWAVLAVIIAIVRAGFILSAIYSILFALLYLFLMIRIVRPFLKRVGELHPTKENLSKPVVAIFFITLVLSAYVAEVIGIHALFGAFLAGAIMPENVKFRSLFIEKVEDIAIVLLLPLFFVFTGLRTQIGLLDQLFLWKITGLIILVAIAGKFLGTALPARLTGLTNKDSFILGALMNTRGLMVLVVLNIGYDIGILTPEIFTMMMIMALVTTMMTAPSLSFIDWVFQPKPGDFKYELSSWSKYHILISFAKPEMGRSLLRLANKLVKKLDENASVTVMHLLPDTEFHQYNLEEYEVESFAPAIDESKKLAQKISTLFKVSNNIDADITGMADDGHYDLLLIGIGQSIFEGSLLGKLLGFTGRIISPDRILNQLTGKENLFGNSPFNERTQAIISGTNVPVGVLIDKGLESTDFVIVPVLSDQDCHVIGFSKKLIRNSGSQVIVWDPSGLIKNNVELKELIKSIEQIAPNHIAVFNDSLIEHDLLEKSNLMIISVSSWKKAINQKGNWLTNIPSTLIISEK
ncbi:cation:proton antiporter [Gaoshiqia sp. Z1-71]|uniref:cation:proton antiporter n=1 Tax=Gaoshiqia hydrogeniformans TaxID=3290090 RepID=UPI003BF90881